MRVERDFLGEKNIQEDVLYGIQTQRALENFPLEYHKTSQSLIQALVQVKKAAALSYQELIPEQKELYTAIVWACDEVLSGKHQEAFVTSGLQGGAGTSTNMNVNEVLANLALLHLGHEPGEYEYVHPLDHVNKGQSTNDVYPTALRIGLIQKLRTLSEACARLQESFQQKENDFDQIQKLGRTELMDAVPITLGQEFGAFAQALARDRWRLYKVEERLRQVNLGGTAVGSGDNAQKKYRYQVIEHLRNLTGIGLATAEYPMDITQNQDVFVEVSGLTKALAVNLMKIAGDIRLMASGPKGGLGELILAPLQMGSTIMPGKVNPVIPEMVIQVAIKAIANDTAITMAAAHGELELNGFLPLIADSILENITILTDAVNIFRQKCIDQIEADPVRCQALLEASFAFGASYTEKLGYDQVALILRDSQGDPASAKEKLDTI